VGFEKTKERKLSKKIIEVRRKIVVKEKAVQINGYHLSIVSDKNLHRMEMTDESCSRLQRFLILFQTMTVLLSR